MSAREEQDEPLGFSSAPVLPISTDTDDSNPDLEGVQLIEHAEGALQDAEMALAGDTTPRRTQSAPAPQPKHLEHVNAAASAASEASPLLGGKAASSRRLQERVERAGDGAPAGPALLQQIPYFGWVMFLACVAGMIVEFYFNSWAVEPLDINFMVGPGLQALIDAGAKDTPLIVHGGEWWRLFTAMFLHAGLVHMAANMSVLFRFGFPMEKEAGCQRFAPVYVLGGLLGSLASAVFIPDILSVGASGACFAIIGAVWADLLQNWGLMLSAGRCGHCTVALICLTISTALNLALGLMPFVDNFAHVFGFLGGMLVGSPLMIRPRRDGKGPSPWQVACAWTGGVLYVILAVTLTIVLFFDIPLKEWCHFCDYISCVELFNLWSCGVEHV